jgi:hypothetical protein
LIYPPELEVIETTDIASSASFLDLYLEFDDSGQLSTKIYKWDDFNFKIINFPNMCSNIPASPAYGVYKKRDTIRTHWYADDLLKQCPSKGDKYAIDEELQHTDHLFLGVACFTFMNFV